MQNGKGRKINADFGARLKITTAPLSTFKKMSELFLFLTAYVRGNFSLRDIAVLGRGVVATTTNKTAGAATTATTITIAIIGKCKTNQSDKFICCGKE